MGSIRTPAVAGMFYPADQQELRAMVDSCLRDAPPANHAPKAMIVPHAGYVYSAPVAASGYARLASVREQIKRVVLLGPSHRVALYGLAMSSADQFATPLGNIPIDKSALSQINDLPQVKMMDQAHELEHSLEVHLPFLQETLSDFMLVPLVVGDASPDEVAQVLERLWGGPETLIVISSDLSHFHDYASAQIRDKRTSNAIENLQPEKIQYDDACGRNPVNGLLTVARKLGLHATTIDLRNSGDTAGDRDRVVGYGTYVFE
ncbi:MAG: AmmeMemoRadiSam system protein B [Gammaproteobacteria bacterium]|nr:AmmeMemoRadiSam system protein B [Gammaproteobacteria bacterium]MDH5593607.1 AmmeMemoRadiSam system protein B [Gammaproteobacteria bacterium]MDH5613600.1 AmmeMemoRadiSam system protein B [Gammaproteobacteria bacterium]